MCFNLACKLDGGCPLLPVDTQPARIVDREPGFRLPAPELVAAGNHCIMDNRYAPDWYDYLPISMVRVLTVHTAKSSYIHNQPSLPSQRWRGHHSVGSLAGGRLRPASPLSAQTAHPDTPPRCLKQCPVPAVEF